MKKGLLLFIFLLIGFYVQSQIVNIPDANFKFKLVNNIVADFDGDGSLDGDVDTNNDGEIQLIEAQAVLTLSVGDWTFPPYNQRIQSLEGIQSFTNLETLRCWRNSITELDLSQNQALKNLRCDYNLLTHLDVSMNPMLEKVWSRENQLISFTAQNQNLKEIYLDGNNLIELDVSGYPNLEELSVSRNNLVKLNIQNGNNGTILKEFDATNNPNLECIQVDDVSNTYFYFCGGIVISWCKDNIATYSQNCGSIIIDIPDVNFKNALVSTNCIDINQDGIGDIDADSNNDGEIQESEASAVVGLVVENRNISSLEGLQKFINLQYLDCASNQITYLSALNNIHLRTLLCMDNQLEFLKVKNYNNAILERMWAFDNPNLECIMVDDVDDANNRICNQGNNIGWCKDSITQYQNVCTLTPIINFPDQKFLNALLTEISPAVDLNGDGQGDVSADFNGDGVIEQSEAEMVIGLELHFKNIISLEGIEYFTSLRALWCDYNYDMTSLDVSQNTELVSLGFARNSITNIDLTHNTNLVTLHCPNNQLTSLDISQNPYLVTLNCEDNQLTSLITQNPNLKEIYCENNQLTSLDVSQNPSLNKIHCPGNQLTSLDVSQNYNLRELSCWNNQLTSLITQNPLLTLLRCHENQLTSLDVSQNTELQRLDCDSNNLLTLDVSQNSNLEILDCYSNNLLYLNIANDNNTNMERMFAFDNYNLNCIQVDDVNYANSLPNCQSSVGWCISATTSYSEFCVLGVNDEILHSISTYPNPVKNVLTIERNLSVDIKSVKIYDLLGKLVLAINSSFNQIDVSNLKSGIFFLKIQTDMGVVTKKIIKK